jgi:hypothetical protein
MREPKMIGLTGLLALLLALLLAGCAGGEARGDGDDDDDSGDDTDTNTDTSTETSACALSALETFDTEIPTGWTVIDGGTSAGTWVWADELPEDFPVAVVIDGGALIDSKAAGQESEQIDELESPLYELGDCTSATVSYDHNFQKDLVGSDVGEVYVIPGDDGTPVLLRTYDTDSSSTQLDSDTVSITATELGEETSFRIVFHYEGSFDLGWYVDNVDVEGVP